MHRHPLDPVSLVFGLVFGAVAALGLADALTIRGADLRWLGPLLFIIFGLTLVVSAGRDRSDGEPVANAAGATGAPGAEPDGEHGRGATAGHRRPAATEATVERGGSDPADEDAR